MKIQGGFCRNLEVHHLNSWLALQRKWATGVTVHDLSSFADDRLLAVPFISARTMDFQVRRPSDVSESTDLEVHRTTAAEATHRLSPNACTDDRLSVVPFISARTMDFQVRRPSDVLGIDGLGSPSYDCSGGNSSPVPKRLHPVSMQRKWANGGQFMTFVHSRTIACRWSTSFLHVRWTSKSVAHPMFSESTDLEVHRTTAAEATHGLSPNACTQFPCRENGRTVDST